MKSIREWKCGKRIVAWGHRPLLMGIVNVTPDSFSDGGRFADPAEAIRYAWRLLEEGSDLLDIGGESSRPGADPVPVEEELRRVLPVIEALAGKADFPLSVDTVKYEVAVRALEAGADIINDVSGLQSDPRLAELAAQTGAGLIIMHRRGTPKTMQSLTQYDHLVQEIHSFFERQGDRAVAVGVDPSQLCFDPGIGFSKTVEQNLQVLRRLPEIRLTGAPLLCGVSRKSFLGAITGKDSSHRRFGTAGAVAVCVWQGVNILRVHDVSAMKDVAEVVQAVCCESLPNDLPIVGG